MVYSQLTDADALLIGGAVMGFFVNGMLGGYGALMSGALPDRGAGDRRRTCCSTSAARVGGFGPVVVGALVVGYGSTTAIALLAVLYLLDIVATLFLIPERKGQALT